MPSWALSDLMSPTTAALGNRVDIPASTVSFWINQAYEDVWNVLPHDQQETSTVTNTTTSDGTVLLPTDFMALVGYPSNISYNQALLRPLNITQLASFSTSTGRPEYFASYGTRLEVRPIPDAAYGLHIRYRRSQSELTLTTAIPSIATRLRSAIFHRAVELLAQNVTLDMERAALAQQSLGVILGGIPSDRSLHHEDQRALIAADPAATLQKSR